MSLPLLYPVAGTLILLVLLSWAWSPNAGPSMPDLKIDLQDLRHDLTVYLKSPRDFGWSRYIERYELQLRWIEPDTPIVLRTLTLRPSKRRRTFEDLFLCTNYLCPFLNIGIGKPETLPAGRYEIGLRAHNGTLWGKWKRKKFEIERPLSTYTMEDQVFICIHAEGVEEGWI